MQALVTRPAHDAAAWVSGLEAQGIVAQALPLIEIAPASDPQPLQDAWQALESYPAAMFVSRNAVEQFFKLKPLGASVPRPFTATHLGAMTRYWATGPGTVQALLAHGVPATSIDAPDHGAAQFDSEALWAQISAQVASAQGKTVLLVRGEDAASAAPGRLWLADQLHAAGVATHTVLAYRRSAPSFTAAQTARMHAAASDGTVWVLSSSQAVEHLRAHLQEAQPLNWPLARAVATHPRIAQAARSAGFGVVCESRPTLEDVARSIKSLDDRA